MYCLVPDLRLDQYLLQVDFERFPEACHSDNHPIRVRLTVVLHTHLTIVNISGLEESSPGTEKWATQTVVGCPGYGAAIVNLSITGPPAELIRHFEDPGISCPHHQRLVSVIHSLRLPSVPQDSVQEGDISFISTADCGRYDGLLHRLFNQFLGNHRILGGRHRVRHAEHLLQEAIYRIIAS